MFESLSSVTIYIALVLHLVSSLISFTSATTYASNVSTTSIGSSEAVITWIAPDVSSPASSYNLFVEDEELNEVVNVTINDITTTTYTISGLIFSTYHNATLTTLDASDDDIGSVHVYFLTEYDPLNLRAVCAIGVVGALILILIIVKAVGIACNPNKEAEKWKKEILAVKQKEREERKKKFSSQAALGSKADLDLV